MTLKDFLSNEYVLAGGIVLATIIFARLVNFLLRRYIDKASEKLRIEPTKYRFFRNFVAAGIYLCGLSVALFVIPEFKHLAVTLFAGAGIFAAIIGFASQQAFSNIVSGIFVVIFKPFSVGDFIQVGADRFGTVTDITLRHTVIKTPENRMLVIPNSVISSETILNSTLGEEKTCAFVEVGISYDSDINTAFRILQEKAMEHEYFLDNRTDEEKAEGDHPVTVRVMGFGDSSVNLRAYVWAETTGKAFVLRTDMYKAVKEAFDEAGVEIPFPYRTIVMKQPQAAVA